eukprot:m.259978 g.259978  ORF g.259978 m.259978 type:complete len:505 (+) comp39004_c0_seq1:151-1665(+)
MEACVDPLQRISNAVLQDLTSLVQMLHNDPVEEVPAEEIPQLPQQTLLPMLKFSRPDSTEDMLFNMFKIPKWSNTIATVLSQLQSTACNLQQYTDVVRFPNGTKDESRVNAQSSSPLMIKSLQYTRTLLRIHCDRSAAFRCILESAHQLGNIPDPTQPETHWRTSRDLVTIDNLRMTLAACHMRKLLGVSVTQARVTLNVKSGLSENNVTSNAQSPSRSCKEYERSLIKVDAMNGPCGSILYSGGTCVTSLSGTPMTLEEYTSSIAAHLQTLALRRTGENVELQGQNHHGNDVDVDDDTTHIECSQQSDLSNTSPPLITFPARNSQTTSHNTPEVNTKHLEDVAVRFHLLACKLEMPISQVLNVESLRGPYVAYNVARCQQLFLKFESDLLPMDQVDFGLLKDPLEWRLALTIGKLWETLRHTIVYGDNDEIVQIHVHKICDYLIRVSDLFSKYYCRVRILPRTPTKPIPRMRANARLWLCTGYVDVVEFGLKLLGCSSMVHKM